MKINTRWKPRTLLHFLAFLLIGAVFGTNNATKAQTPYTFSNSQAINIIDNAPANPYPSQINVSGIPTGSVTRVTVTLNNFTHSYPDDVGVLLVSPTGQKVRIFSDCMGDGGGNGVSNLTLTFDDNAATALPDNPLSATPSGTYKPRRGTSDGFSPEHPANFPAPAPAGPYADTLAGFNGMNNPNGSWQILIDDDGKGDAGTIAGGWSLTIYSSAPTAALVRIGGTVKGMLGVNISEARLELVGGSGEPRFAYTDRLGRYSFEDVEIGNTYTMSISAKGYNFTLHTKLLTVNDTMTVDWFSEN